MRRVTDRILRGMEKRLEAEGGGNMITKQLEGLEWEVVVATPAACYIGAGKIMINALLLFAFRKDEEIGMIIGKKDYVVFFYKFLASNIFSSLISSCFSSWT